MVNKSPWTLQLIRNRELKRLKHNEETDIVIVGGGIAGLTNAFFILENTDLRVTVIEAGKVAHGATGHNAGQVVMYLERSFESIVKEFGIEMAKDGQKDIISSWKLLKHIHKKIKAHTHLSEFTGYAGLSTKNQLKEHLDNMLLMKKAGIKMEGMLIAKEYLQNHKLDDKYHSLYKIVSKNKILSLIESNNENYIASVYGKKGLINSAIFTEEISQYLVKKYPNRLNIYEESPVKKIVLHSDISETFSRKRIISKKIILCTNGFHNIKIINKAGKNINSKFHKNVKGEIGYMAGYLEEFKKDPLAVSYFTRKEKITNTGEVYFYLTRRTYHKKDKAYNLICIGGPQIALKKKMKYNEKTHKYPEKSKEDINKFLRENYKHNSQDRVDFHYLWHGLMGYTKGMLRMVGQDPYNPNLIYNLGCNGAGILTSIYGSNKVSLILKGKKFKPSIFDIR